MFDGMLVLVKVKLDAMLVMVAFDMVGFVDVIHFIDLESHDVRL